MFRKGREIIQNPLAAIPLTVALGLGGTACSRAGAEEEQSAWCFSDRTVSHLYPEDPNAAPNDQENWETGIRVETRIPDGATALIIGFSGLEAEWKDSLPMPVDRADDIALRIGDGDVMFSTRLQAPVGSVVCELTPRSTFGETEDFDPLVAAGAAKPTWP